LSTIYLNCSLKLYRDCLRLIRHVAPGRSAKALALRKTVRTEFSKRRDLADEKEVEQSKEAAVRALSNYLLMVSKDPALTGKKTK